MDDAGFDSVHASRLCAMPNAAGTGCTASGDHAPGARSQPEHVVRQFRIGLQLGERP